jgi:hypothetical protein
MATGPTQGLTFARACRDEHLFGPWFSGPSWATWRVIDKALFGEPLTPAELAIFRDLTGRKDAPTEPASEAWIIGGRRGGKDVKAAALVVYLATVGVELYGWRKYLTLGESGVVQLLAVDRDQAKICFDYTRAFFGQRMLAKLVQRSTADTLELTNGFKIEITTSDQRRVRGRTVCAAVFDEVAHWRSEDSLTPDKEIFRAIKPSMATIPNALLIGISSPYARKGLLFEKFSEHYGKPSSTLVVKAPTWTLNPTLPEDCDVIREAFVDDPAWASAEYGAEFRSDVEGFLSLETLGVCIDDVAERPPQSHLSYVGFVDPSGGASDSMTLAIAHAKGKAVVLDAVREIQAPFSPGAAVEEFAALLARYQVWTVVGDRYAGEWPREAFQARGISYEPSERNKSEIYQTFLPLVNSRRVALIEHRRLRQQFLALERRTTRGGRDSIDHPRGAHDDLANAAAGVCVLALERGDALPFRRMPAYAVNNHDPLADWSSQPGGFEAVANAWNGGPLPSHGEDMR